ncbi:MAG: hypothetical protein KF725_14775 [Cyclobacteriaceae bacterium]|nr:hypothetical protein [Cyclobacteriaceae bacterium]UYN87382.1 MAG: hypothetical protein KIT51_03680 [Cyclobacteriaceae bacterium]
MKLLVISISAPPKNSPESVQTGRYLYYLSKNHEVTLLTTRVTGGWEPEDKSLEKYLQNIRSHVSLTMLHPKILTVVKRILPFVVVPDDDFIFPKLFRFAETKVPQGSEIIFSRSAPFSSALMALKFSRNWNLPWIMHLSDPWGDNPFQPLTKFPKKRNKLLERICIEQAKLVTLTSVKTVKYYQQKYPNHAHKFRLLPNVFDDAFINTTPIEFIGKIKFVLTGRLYGSRSIFQLMDAIERSIRIEPMFEDQSEFIFAGFFDQKNIDRIKQSKAKNVKYMGHLSMQEAIRLQQSSSVLVAIDALEQDPIFDLFFPSKLLDYFTARRYILAITSKNSTTHDLVDQKFGSCFNAENIHKLPDHLLFLTEQFFAKNRNLFEINENFMEYSASQNAAKLEALLREVVE